MASSTKSVVLNIVPDEKFEEVYRPNEDAIRIVDNGRTCEKGRGGSFGCTLGHYSYSSGVHLIRIEVHHGTVFMGIRSRNIQVVPKEIAGGTYILSPSTYGWWSNGWGICNGYNAPRGPGESNLSNVVFTLVLNCDEHRLSILYEDSKERCEMEVDPLHAVFPWCLFVELARAGGSASIIQPRAGEVSPTISTKEFSGIVS